jgi:hypothetical protein
VGHRPSAMQGSIVAGQPWAFPLGSLDLMFVVCCLAACALWLCYPSEISLIPERFDQD